MKKIVKIVLYVLCLFILSSCFSRKGKTEITIENNTGVIIEILNCDSNVDINFPITVEKNDYEIIVFERIVESARFTIYYNEAEYYFSTDYIQESSNVIIELTDDNNSLSAVLKVGSEQKLLEVIKKN